MLSKVTWPAVALVAVVMAGLFGLSAIHADTRILLDVLIALGLGGIGAGLAAVHGKVNGNLEEFMRIIKENAQMLYKATPPADETKPPEE